MEYFKIKLGDQDKKWAPHIICVTCLTNLTGWSKGRRKRMPFAIPMIWRQQKDHSTDCYFCSVNIQGFNSKNKISISYPNLSSAIRPVAHSDELPIPDKEDNQDTDDLDNELLEDEQHDKTYEDDMLNQKFSKKELNDLVRDLNLPKDSSEFLASRLAEKGMLQPDVKISFYRNRERKLLQYFSEDNDFVYCNDIDSLLNAIGLPNYFPAEWRLFIDSSKRSLKCVLLHNGNRFGSIPIAHSVKAKETYENVKHVLQLICYNQHQWPVSVDLKMVSILLGQQMGYTKYPCFHCLWDSRAKNEHER